MSDVGFASLAGATTVLDGSLPYGNLPPASWSMATPIRCSPIWRMCPAALVSPVHDGFDGLDGALYVATALRSLLGALALGAGSAATPAGSIAFVAFPPVMIAASSAPAMWSRQPSSRARLH